MNYYNILNRVGNLISNDPALMVPLLFILFLLLFFIISRTFRKSGLFILALSFGIDYFIRSLPLDIYQGFPIVKTFINGLYILGALIFIIKVFRILIKISSKDRIKEREGKSKGFFAYTGSFPFIIMVIINVIDANNLLPSEIKRLLTSLSFLYMVFRSLMSTYKYINKKDLRLIKDKMKFDDIDDYLKETEKKDQDKNRQRRIRKSLDDDIKIYKGLSEDKTSSIPVSDLQMGKTKVYKRNQEIERLEKELSKVDIIDLVTSKDEGLKTKISLRITDIASGRVKSYTSTNAQFNMVEEKEYKVDLEFRHVNEYDYGRFIDILIEYAKDQDSYKFELIVSPLEKENSKIVLYDPSNIFDLDEEAYQNIGGRVISMNFPKYKINFITGN
ncbi:MAG: hypothetical protein Q4D88_04260 [Anaerococcus sp.]|nr:hypothetical protein [Anaerococcus sp.]